MGIKNDPNNPGTFIVSYSKRHPITRMPASLTRKGFRTKAEAKRALAQLIIAVEKKLTRSITPTWGEMVEDNSTACLERGLMRKTIYNLETCVKAYTIEKWGDRLITSITALEIRNLIDHDVGHRSPSHQKYLLKGIRGVFNHAVEAGHINRNPCPQMKFKIGDKIQKVLTEDQARTLLLRAKKQNWQWHPHYAVALYTGMRNGELYALTWDNVHFDQKTILVNSSWSNKDGYKSTKSGDDRVIGIAPALLPILSELQSLTGDTPYVLPHFYEWSQGDQARQLAMFLEANGLPTCRFHDLRATWATMLLSKGVEPIKVMKMGGWKDLETMMIYARKAGVDIKGAMDCINLQTDTPGNLLKLTSCSNL